MIKDNISILKLFISSKETLTKIERNNIMVDNNGIIEDKFYGKNINRSVLLSSINAYKIIKEKNINVKYGQLGENILIDYNPYDFKIGTKIQIGEVVLEITQHGTFCNSLKKIDKLAPILLKNDRGVFAKIIKSGLISKQDTISII
jgi:MOSC domain-containing protein YiiM